MIAPPRRIREPVKWVYSGRRMAPRLEHQGADGLRIKLTAHERLALAQIGEGHYASLGMLARDLLRMALAPRVAVIAEAKHKQEQWAREKFDKSLQRQRSERAERRANPMTPADLRLISDEPLETLATSVPASDCAALKSLAAQRSTTVSALLRELIREALARAGQAFDR